MGAAARSARLVGIAARTGVRWGGGEFGGEVPCGGGEFGGEVWRRRDGHVWSGGGEIAQPVWRRLDRGVRPIYYFFLHNPYFQKIKVPAYWACWA